MTSITSKNNMKAIVLALIAVIMLSFTGINSAQAVQKKSTDTVSTSDVTFTDIPTAADTIAARKKAAQEAAKAKPAAPAKAASTEMPKNLWQIFIEGLLGGFTALLLPCIYPLLPLTVSFFTKQSGTRAGGIFKSVIYGLSIIVIYVTLGLIITILFGSDALNALSTNGVFNIFFFLLLAYFLSLMDD